MIGGCQAAQEKGRSEENHYLPSGCLEKVFMNPWGWEDDVHQSLHDLKSSWKQIVILAVGILYVAINLFRWGGNQFIIRLNDNIANPLALGVTAIAMILWMKMAAGSRNRLLWGGLALGWAFWSIAEVWWGIAAFIGQEVPYPSWADLFWLAGYLPMGIALVERIRALPATTYMWQKVGIWITALASGGLTVFFVILPILRNYDPALIVENGLNVFYPVADLAVIILVLRIFFTYQHGQYGQAWAWLSIGFIIHSFADITFSYANLGNLYYPDGQLNFLSTLGVDVPYNLSYLIWLIGLLIVHSIHESHQTFTDATIPTTLVPNVHLLVFTKGDDTIIDVSQNYWPIFPSKKVKGSTVAEALGISPHQAGQLLKNARSHTIIKEQIVVVHSSEGDQQAKVSAIADINPEGVYLGVIFLLRMLAKEYSLDQRLSTYHKEIVRSLLAKTGARQQEESEIKALLTSYYQVYLRAFYTRLLTEGGSVMANTFLEEVQNTIRQHNWPIEIHPGTLLDVGALTLSQTQEALPELFKTARQHVSNIIDEATANAIVQKTRSCFGDPLLENVAYAEKA